MAGQPPFVVSVIIRKSIFHLHISYLSYHIHQKPTIKTLKGKSLCINRISMYLYSITIWSNTY